MRLRALKDMGIEEIDVSIVKADTEAQRIKYALSDNDRAGEYEEQKLAELVYPYIEEINLEDFKVDLGEAVDMKSVIEEFGPNLDGEEDEVPEKDDSPAVSKLGDLFTLGRHRLLCGDATKEADVARLMDGEKAGMVFTDPPYGIDVVQNNAIGGGGAFGGKKNLKSDKSNFIKANRYEPIIGDNEDYDPQHLLGIAQICCIWGANNFADKLPNSRGWIVWDKIDGVRGTTKNFSDVEMAWTNQNQPARIVRHRWQGLLKASEHGEKRIHPTQKPIALVVECFKLLPPIKLAVDLFLGSGTTLIACEKLNCICYGMEIEPKYCDVIITRYCNYTDTPEEEIRATVEHG